MNSAAKSVSDAPFLAGVMKIQQLRVVCFLKHLYNIKSGLNQQLVTTYCKNSQVFVSEWTLWVV